MKKVKYFSDMQTRNLDCKHVIPNFKNVAKLYNTFYLLIPELFGNACPWKECWSRKNCNAYQLLKTLATPTVEALDEFIDQ